MVLNTHFPSSHLWCSFDEADLKVWSAVSALHPPAVSLSLLSFREPARTCSKYDAQQLSVLLWFVSSGVLLNEQHFSHKSQTSIHSQNCWGQRICLLPLSYAYRLKNVLLLCQCCYSPEKVNCSWGRHNAYITHKTTSYSRSMIKNYIKNNWLY